MSSSAAQIAGKRRRNDTRRIAIESGRSQDGHRLLLTAHRHRPPGFCPNHRKQDQRELLSTLTVHDPWAPENTIPVPDGARSVGLLLYGNTIKLTFVVPGKSDPKIAGVEPPTAEKILVGWLKNNHYDGLFNDDLDCACERTYLAPCEGIQRGCRPGYKTTCECGDHDWHIEEVKR